MFACEKASVAVRGRTLLEEASVTVAPGELVAVVGQNGAGKSTLLKMLSGEMRPSRGEVSLEGRALAAWDPLELARARAVLSQSPRLDFGFSALEVVLMGRWPHNRGEVRPRDLGLARAALEAVDAAPLAHRPYPSLSGGEQQRVQLARALVQVWDPAFGTMRGRYLLLDEPTSSLDPAHGLRLLALARRLAGEGMGVLAVLHDLNLAARFATRVVVMHRGRVVGDGPPRDTLTPQTFQEAFGLSVMLLEHPIEGTPVIVPVAAAG